MLIASPLQTRRALLTWQRPLGYGGSRDRFAVGEFVQHEDGVSFRALPGGIADARAQGFEGYPGLATEDGDEAVRVLLRRLPPRGRGDFGEYLEGFGLAADAPLTDLSLLAYTGARVISESDGFGVTETFDGFERPFRYPFEVAGYRHYREALPPLETGQPLHVIPDDDNPRDADAVQVVTERGECAGYINRYQAPQVRDWLRSAPVALRVFRLGTRPAYPRLFVMADVRAQDATVEAV